MTKLSDKDQELLRGKSFIHIGDDAAVFAMNQSDVEKLLIQKYAEHKAEIEKLKAQIHTDKIMTQIRHNQKEHDKQVKIDVLENLVEQSTFRGLRNSVQPEELDEYINKIKEQ